MDFLFDFRHFELRTMEKYALIAKKALFQNFKIIIDTIYHYILPFFTLKIITPSYHCQAKILLLPS